MKTRVKKLFVYSFQFSLELSDHYHSSSLNSEPLYLARDKDFFILYLYLYFFLLLL